TAEGSIVPPSGAFDVTNGNPAILPKPQKNSTFQTGSVFKSGRLTLDVDLYHIKFDNTYTQTTDASGEPVWYLGSTSTTKGVEAESTVILGAGLSAYLNGTVGSAKYNNTGLWVQNAPKNTETIGLTYQQKNWDLGFFSKRIGPQWNDNGTLNQAIPIDPFELTNLYLNYTIKNHSEFSQTKIKFSINNLTNNESIVGVPTPASAKSNLPAAGDILTILAGRSISLGLTFGYSPHH